MVKPFRLSKLVYSVVILSALSFPLILQEPKSIGVSAAQLLPIPAEVAPLAAESASLAAEQGELVDPVPASGSGFGAGQTKILSFENKIIADRDAEVDPLVEPRKVFVPAQIDVEQITGKGKAKDRFGIVITDPPRVVLVDTVSTMGQTDTSTPTEPPTDATTMAPPNTSTPPRNSAITTNSMGWISVAMLPLNMLILLCF